MERIILAAVVALALSLLLTPVAKWLAPRWGAIDKPDERKAVSYTHLDVYKRQIYIPGTTDGKNCIVTFDTTKAYGNFMAVGAKTHTTADGSEATDPTVDSTCASIYGHWAEDDIIFMQQKFIVLETADVYKRQFVGCLRGRNDANNR